MAIGIPYGSDKISAKGFWPLGTDTRSAHRKLEQKTRKRLTKRVRPSAGKNSEWGGEMFSLSPLTLPLRRLLSSSLFPNRRRDFFLSSTGGGYSPRSPNHQSGRETTAPYRLSSSSRGSVSHSGKVHHVSLHLRDTHVIYSARGVGKKSSGCNKKF